VQLLLRPVRVANFTWLTIQERLVRPARNPTRYNRSLSYDPLYFGNNILNQRTLVKKRELLTFTLFPKNNEKIILRKQSNRN
jgi:hypothetical protein